MEGEQIKMFGITYMHYEKKIKVANFQPRIPELRATYRRYWYNNYLIFLIIIYYLCLYVNI
jgi:hypothetical protein